ncbi:corticosteroid 11-beta-dehydrogenase isozyme 2 [Labeo rohita]|uniref:11-beta-hydroxysteroid dehydrogenase type 2 n=1 Tax=Labeo rohita TaxID=84645 RepID=A0A498MLG5_LABRO|nr:corticosteroid 11-beta-dehydrogenase isozyme 2 [Labeo rohita]
MEDFAVSFWIYIGVMSVFVGGAVKKFLAFHIGAMPSVVAWLGATLLLERLCALCMPAVLARLVLCVSCWLYFTWATPKPFLPVEGKAVFITAFFGLLGFPNHDVLWDHKDIVLKSKDTNGNLSGCDSGFGNATAKRLDAMGFEVFATVLNLDGEGAKHLRRVCSSRLTLLQVDITQPQQIEQALLDTKAKLGMRDLWGLVNNAGWCVNVGDAELSLMSNYRGCMEVNFFGTLTVTRTFLPLLRQSKGRIVTISSPSGEHPFPCLASYGASKAALNLFINTLRHEQEPWGVKFSTILPSAFKTGQSSNTEYWEKQYKNLIQNLPPSLLEEYGEEYLLETKELFQSHAKTANEDLSPVINTIVDALLSPQPQCKLSYLNIFISFFFHNY